jgi:hypothetical protein
MEKLRNGATAHRFLLGKIGLSTVRPCTPSCFLVLSVGFSQEHCVLLSQLDLHLELPSKLRTIQGYPWLIRAYYPYYERHIH